MLTAIAGSASLAEGQYSTAILLLFSSMATISIALVGWKHGNKKIHSLDVFCLLGAMLGITMWLTFDSPAIAILVTISTDLLGGIPTILHSWKKPNEELAITYILSFIGVTCTLLSVSDWRISSFAYPIYSMIMNLLFSLIIVLRKRFLKTKKR
jgi:hypothetical protein